MALSCLWAVLGIQPCAAAGSYNDFPAADVPPPALAGPTALQLEIVVNGVASGMIVPVIVDHAHFRMTAGDLRLLALPAPGDPTAMVTVDALPGVTVDYDVPNQQLKIQVPPAWLPHQRLDLADREKSGPARSNFGLLFNYDLYALDADNAAPSASLWTEIRTFGKVGLFSTTGVFRVDGNSGRARPRTEYTRYDSRWVYSDESRMITYEAGDFITRTLPWSGAIRLGGVQISRDFSVRPDIITYPVPQFSGEASLPSAVELFIDNHQAFGGDVRPGPFTMNPLPQISGAGQANIVVTDALGRRVSTTLPFYVSSALLRPGLTDYAAALGAIRRNYGLRNFDYGTPAASASFRHGFNDYLTLEGQAQGTTGLAMVGGGAVLRVGNLGVVNAAYSRSWHDGSSGGQLSIGYQYQQRDFSFSASHVRQDAGFFDLAALDRSSGSRISGQMTSVTSSLALGRFGSFGAGYFDSRWRDRNRTRLINTSWSLPVIGSSSLYASASREIGHRNWALSLSLLVPLGGDRGTVSSNITRDRDNRSGARLDYNRPVPTQGGIGWNASIARLGNRDIYGNAELTWRNRYTELRGGTYGSKGDTTRWVSAAGSIIMMDETIFAANRVADAFALVSTNGQPGIPVYYENQLAGRSDARGHVLIPWASAYYAAKYTIDPLDLPVNMSADVVEQRVAVARGSGYLLDFPVRAMVAARLTLRDKHRTPLPVGAIVRVNDKGMTYVGWDGLVFVEDLATQNRLAVTLPDGAVCHATFAMDGKSGQIADIGTLTCQ